MSYPFELRRREAAAIERRRAIARGAPQGAPTGPPPDRLPDDTVALALSGGGIRCAALALGVLQALAKRRRLSQIDLLSTVSGGGYAGGFLGRLYTRLVGARGQDPCARVTALLSDDRSAPLQWMRANANYIVSQGNLDVRQHLAAFWRNLTCIYVVLGLLGFSLFGLLRLLSQALPEAIAPLSLFGERAATLSLWWWLPPLVLVAGALPMALAFVLSPRPGTHVYFGVLPITGWLILLTQSAVGLAFLPTLWPSAAAGGVALLAVAWLESARSRLPHAPDRATRESPTDPSIVTRNRLTRGLGEALVLLLVSLGWVALDSLARGFAQGTLWKMVAAWGAVLAPFLPFLRGWAARLGAGGGATSSVSPGLRAALIVFPLVAFLLVVLDGGVHWLFDHHGSLAVALLLPALTLSFVLGRELDFLNYSSLQQTYAARLGRTFLGATNPARFREASEENVKDVQLSHPDDDVSFAEYHPEATGGPLHLIGLCVNETVDATSQREIRDRKGLPMCVGPCGVSVGRRFHSLWSRPAGNGTWRARLVRWLGGREPLRLDRASALLPIPVSGELFHVLKGKGNDPVTVEGLRLGSWISISGAAFGTGAGRSTSLPLALLFGLTNVRLGYWWDSGIARAERPGQYPHNFWRQLRKIPAWLVPMQNRLLSEFQGRFEGPSHRYWNISDGGHFDNTGLYELLRRRVPFILAVDGSADPELTFDDGGELARQVRVDFGANVEYVDPVPALQDGLAPDWIRAWLAARAFGKVSDVGKGAHAALARVTYADSERVTWIAYLKASLTGDETIDIAAYKRRSEPFPSEPTTDQFFDEAQWESYRKLGEHIGLGALA